MTKRRILTILGGLWLLTGVYMVRVDEQAVVRRFGRVVADRVPPGLHLGWPWGIDKVDRLKVREQKRLNIGFEAADQTLGRTAGTSNGECFTGDQNLVNVELLVQYTIDNPRAYLFSAADATQVLQEAAEAAVTSTVGERSVDTLLTTGKLAAQDELRRRTQQASYSYELGLTITAVNIAGVNPPLSVVDAFREVASARADRDRFIQEAHSYANATLPAAQGEAAKIGEEAAGYRTAAILKAQGDAARFTQAYDAYRRAPGVSSARLYFEAMEQILPRVKIISVERDGKRNSVDLNLLPRPATAVAPIPTPLPDAATIPNATPNTANPTPTTQALSTP